MNPTVLLNASVLDPRAGTLLPDRSVVIRGGNIEEVTDTRVRAKDAVTIDLRGRTLMPGLIDSHVHATQASADFAELRSWSPYYSAARVSQGVARDAAARLHHRPGHGRRRPRRRARRGGRAVRRPARAVRRAHHRADRRPQPHPDLRRRDRTAARDPRTDVTRRAPCEAHAQRWHHLHDARGLARLLGAGDPCRGRRGEPGPALRRRSRLHGRSGQPRSALRRTHHRTRQPHRRGQRRTLRTARGFLRAHAGDVLRTRAAGRRTRPVRREPHASCTT